MCLDSQTSFASGSPGESPSGGEDSGDVHVVHLEGVSGAWAASLGSTHSTAVNGRSSTRTLWGSAWSLTCSGRPGRAQCLLSPQRAEMTALPVGTLPDSNPRQHCVPVIGKRKSTACVRSTGRSQPKVERFCAARSTPRNHDFSAFSSYRRGAVRGSASEHSGSFLFTAGMASTP